MPKQSIEPVAKGQPVSALKTNQQIGILNAIMESGLLAGNNLTINADGSLSVGKPQDMTNEKAVIICRASNSEADAYNGHDVVIISGQALDSGVAGLVGDPILSVRKPTTGDDASVALAVCQGYMTPGIVGKVAIFGVCFANVYRATNPGTASIKAGIVVADGVCALKVGSTGVPLLWEETVSNYTVPHLGLVALGRGSKGDTGADGADGDDGADFEFVEAATKAALAAATEPNFAHTTGAAKRYYIAHGSSWDAQDFLE